MYSLQYNVLQWSHCTTIPLYRYNTDTGKCSTVYTIVVHCSIPGREMTVIVDITYFYNEHRVGSEYQTFKALVNRQSGK